MTTTGGGGNWGGYSRFHAIVQATPSAGALEALPPRPTPAYSTVTSTSVTGVAGSDILNGNVPGGEGGVSESGGAIAVGGGAGVVGGQTPSDSSHQHPNKRRKISHITTVEDAGGGGFAKALKSASRNESAASRQRPHKYPTQEHLLESLRAAFKRSAHVDFHGTFDEKSNDPNVNVPHKARVQTLTVDIWRATGYRFTVKDHPRISNGHKTRFWCSQDEAHRSKSSKLARLPNSTSKPRVSSAGEALAKTRYSCRSRLLISSRDASSSDTSAHTGVRIITVRMHHHTAHEPYVDTSLPPELAAAVYESFGWSSVAGVAIAPLPAGYVSSSAAASGSAAAFASMGGIPVEAMGYVPPDPDGEDGDAEGDLDGDGDGDGDGGEDDAEGEGEGDILDGNDRRGGDPRDRDAEAGHDDQTIGPTFEPTPVSMSMNVPVSISPSGTTSVDQAFAGAQHVHSNISASESGRYDTSYHVRPPANASSGGVPQPVSIQVQHISVAPGGHTRAPIHPPSSAPPQLGPTNSTSSATTTSSSHHGVTSFVHQLPQQQQQPQVQVQGIPTPPLSAGSSVSQSHYVPAQHSYQQHQHQQQQQNTYPQHHQHQPQPQATTQPHNSSPRPHTNQGRPSHIQPYNLPHPSRPPQLPASHHAAQAAQASHHASSHPNQSPHGTSSQTLPQTQTQYQSTSEAAARYHRIMLNHITNIREFCSGLEYQLQFNDYRMLDVLEREGEGFLRLVSECLGSEGRLVGP